MFSAYSVYVLCVFFQFTSMDRSCLSQYFNEWMSLRFEWCRWHVVVSTCCVSHANVPVSLTRYECPWLHAAIDARMDERPRDCYNDSPLMWLRDVFLCSLWLVHLSILPAVERQGVARVCGGSRTARDNVLCLASAVVGVAGVVEAASGRCTFPRIWCRSSMSSPFDWERLNDLPKIIRIISNCYCRPEL